MKRIMVVFLVSLVIAAGINFLAAEEGMYTPDRIKDLHLDKKGMKISASKVFNPGKKGLQEAIILLGGGTSEFVSPDGLILTNHHVAFDAVASLSSVEHDYTQEGFIAKGIEEEIPAQNLSARILRRYEDVTRKALEGVDDETPVMERREIIRKNRETILGEARDKDSSLEYSVVSYYDGNKFYLQGYYVLHDIRVVYVPPASIGVYGGDIDNWMWPRHTGDFAFLRAYVDRDGNGAEYSGDNVPYKPKTWIKTAGDGISEGDFVFIMGFPGTTFRYRDAYYVDYEATVALPFYVELLTERLKVLEAAGKKSHALQLEYASMVKSYNNVLKNYIGTLEGFKKLGVIAKKRREDEEFTAWLKSDSQRWEKYGDILPSIEHNYEKQKAFAARENVVIAFRQARLVGMAMDLLKNAEHPADNISDLKMNVENTLKNLFMPLESSNFRFAFTLAQRLEGEDRFPVIEELLGNAEGRERALRAVAAAGEVYDFSREIGILNDEKREQFYEMSVEELLDSGDLFFKIADMVMNESARIQAASTVLGSRHTVLQRRLTEAQILYRESQGAFLYPDANRTLRFTYGYVKGYSPRDAVYYKPFTTLRGVMEKETGSDPFEVPEKLKEVYNSRDFGKWTSDELGGMPVNFLSTNDITGGNSGSPVLNADGELVGCVFDGDWEAITSDYEFIPELTRSISVDIRYVLLVTETFGAGYLLDEMKIKRN